MAKKPTPITGLKSLRPQVNNANRHTARGLGMLEDSLQKDGFIGAITVAADGETFDGSARVEVGAGAGFDDAIIVRSDGTKPIIHIREDIATADDPKARRLGLAANRVAQVDLDYDADVLAALRDDGLLEGLFFDDELSKLLGSDDDTGVDGGSQDVPSQFMIIIECQGEAHQAELLQRFNEDGLQCRALIS